MENKNIKQDLAQNLTKGLTKKLTKKKVYPNFAHEKINKSIVLSLEESGRTVESIRRRIASGFRKLRIQHAHTLRDYCEPARVYNMAVQGCGVGTYSRTWESSTERTAFKELERIERLRAVLLSELKSTD